MGACWRSAGCSVTTATSTVDDAPTAADDATPADDAAANDVAANDAVANDAVADDAVADDATTYDAAAWLPSTTNDAAWLSPAANDAATSTRLWLPNVGPATDDATATYAARSCSLLLKIRSRSSVFLLPEVQTSAD